MGDEKISQEFRLKSIDETRNYFVKKIDQNELMSEKHKKACASLNYIKHFLILASAITRCISIPTFPSLVGIPVTIMSSAVELKICAITAAIKKFKSIIKKKKNKHDEIVLWTKTKLNSIEALIIVSKVLIDSFISHDEF